MKISCHTIHLAYKKVEGGPRSGNAWPYGNQHRLDFCSCHGLIPRHGYEATTFATSAMKLYTVKKTKKKTGYMMVYSGLFLCYTEPKIKQLIGDSYETRTTDLDTEVEYAFSFLDSTRLGWAGVRAGTKKIYNLYVLYVSLGPCSCLAKQVIHLHLNVYNSYQMLMWLCGCVTQLKCQH